MSLRLAANLSWLFTELEFLERFGAAAKHGFRAVEMLFPYAYDAAGLAARLQSHGLEQVLFNFPPGNWDAGERGMAALPGREDEFRGTVETGLAYAAALACPRVHVMAGNPPAGADRARCEAVFVENLRYAAAQAASAGVTLCLEPLNATDFPDYFLGTVAQAARIVDLTGAPNVKIQYDVYHQQMSRGALVQTLRDNIAAIGHVQIAGVPGRNEPDADQEINFARVFAALDEAGYAGWVGCEYRPRNGTAAGLGWAHPYGITAA